MIAWHNVKHCREAGGEGYYIDTYYLRNLGPEAIPALDWLSQRVPNTATGNLSGLGAMVLREQLRYDLSEWRTWTYRKSQLKQSTSNSDNSENPSRDARVHEGGQVPRAIAAVPSQIPQAQP